MGKGFGHGNLLCEEYDDIIVAEIRDAVGADGILVWDGDEFYSDSFTRVIHKVLMVMDIPAVAFYFRSGQLDFLRSWSAQAQKYSGRVYLVLLDDPSGGWPPREEELDQIYLRLGRQALQLT